jgi:hypothetical protein
MSKDSLTDIPLVDIRSGSPVDLVRQFPDSAIALARAAANTFGVVSRIGSRLIFPIGDRLSLAWLDRTDNPYRAEIRTLVSLLGIRGTAMLNLCFEWGCTSGVWETPEGPVMRRVLDWPFPSLGEHMIVAHQEGPAGAFFNITWPGLSGSFHAMAPGRFAAALNQAPMQRHGKGYIGDWTRNRRAVRDGNGLPPAHLLRSVFETAADYAQARQLLSRTTIAIPAIYILSGPGTGEGCVIERTEREFVIREMGDARVCATNHFVSRLNETGQWMARRIDSRGRLVSAQALEAGPTADLAWFAPPIANVNSRVVFSANVATGALTLMGTLGERPVTRPFKLVERLPMQ